MCLLRAKYECGKHARRKDKDTITLVVFVRKVQDNEYWNNKKYTNTPCRQFTNLNSTAGMGLLGPA